MKLFSNPGYGLLLLRLMVGGVFLYHGITKLQNMQGTIGFFGSLGLPSFLAWTVALIESIGGALMVLGVWPMAVGALFALIMIGAIVKTKLGGSFMAAEKEVILLVCSLALAFGGAGACSLIKCIRHCTHKDSSEAASAFASSSPQVPPIPQS